jgi:hypothetical protein
MCLTVFLGPLRQVLAAARQIVKSEPELHVCILNAGAWLLHPGRMLQVCRTLHPPCVNADRGSRVDQKVLKPMPPSPDHHRGGKMLLSEQIVVDRPWLSRGLVSV